MSVTTSFRFTDDLNGRMRQWCEQRKMSLSVMVAKAIEAYIGEGVGDRELVAERRQDIGRHGSVSKKMVDSLNAAILERMEQDSSFISAMDAKDFARLVAGRLPKEEIDEGLERQALTLRELVSGLPDMGDVTDELSRVRLKLKEAETERDLAREAVSHADGGTTLEELMRSCYGLVIEYVWECIVRNSLPGIGDGGGLTDKAREQIAKRVQQDLQRMAP